MKRLIVLLSLIVGFATPLCAAPEGVETFIVVFSHHGELKDADVAAAGGTVQARVTEYLVATLAPAAAERLRLNKAVAYLQRVGEPGTDTHVPEPRVETQAVTRRAAPMWAAPTWSSGEYQYDGAGNISAIGTSAHAASDARTVSYGYDPGSRLVKWTDSTLAGPETYGYDVYGNMTSVSRYNGNGSTVTFGVAASTNQISTAAYDAAGNLVSGDGSGRTYEYDGLNMMRKSGSTVEGWRYDVYGPDEERLGVLDTATGMWTWSARGFDAQVLRQFRSSSVTPSADWLWVEDYVYRGGTLAAAERVTQQGGRRHFHLDHLGTPRLVTGPSHELVAQHDHTPYGIEVTSPCQETSNGFEREEPKRFTMHEREFAPNCSDATVLDYMHARFYSAGWGRFVSVDPAFVASYGGSASAYVYVRNRPSTSADPTGLWDVWLPSGKDATATVCGDCDAPGVGPSGFLGGNDTVREIKESAKLAWKDFKNEFKDGGCVAVFLDASADALNPFTPSVTTAAEPAAYAAAAMKYNAALRYAASRPNSLGGTGLVYPMKSSVVRSMLADANTAAASGVMVSVDLAIATGLYEEIKAMRSGTCQ